MKKLLLIVSLCLFSLLTFAQTSLSEIPFSDGNTYSYAETFSTAGGTAICVPIGTFGVDTAWNLSTYRGLEFTFVCDTADLDEEFGLRLVMVDTATSSAASFAKTVTFSDTTAVVSFDFDEDCSGHHLLWGIKVNGWDAATLDSVVKVISIIAQPKLEYTSLSEIPFSDGETYSYAETFSTAGGTAICVPNGTFGVDTAWNLSDYTGMEFTFVCDTADLGEEFGLRLVMVDTATSSAVSFAKTVTFSDTTAVVNFDFDEDCSGYHLLWGIKVNGWDAATLDSVVKVVSIYVISIDDGGSTAIEEIKDDESFEVQNLDPNRLVRVYNLNGQIVRNSVKYSEATIGLKRGIYIVDRKKVYVNNRY